MAMPKPKPKPKPNNANPNVRPTNQTTNQTYMHRPVVERPADLIDVEINIVGIQSLRLRIGTATIAIAIGVGGSNAVSDFLNMVQDRCEWVWVAECKVHWRKQLVKLEGPRHPPTLYRIVFGVDQTGKKKKKKRTENNVRHTHTHTHTTVSRKSVFERECQMHIQP